MKPPKKPSLNSFPPVTFPRDNKKWENGQCQIRCPVPSFLLPFSSFRALDGHRLNITFVYYSFWGTSLNKNILPFFASDCLICVKITWEKGGAMWQIGFVFSKRKRKKMTSTSQPPMCRKSLQIAKKNFETQNVRMNMYSVRPFIHFMMTMPLKCGKNNFGGNDDQPIQILNWPQQPLPSPPFPVPFPLFAFPVYVSFSFRLINYLSPFPHSLHFM
jgi:hypothetical protein